MEEERSQIEEIVNRETMAWDTKDIDLLMTIFHPEAVWAWPPDADSHDPTTWVLALGKFDYSRWSQGWISLFESHDLIHNNRETKCIKISAEGDGAFAVVDIDTLWRNKKTGEDFHWLGRTCKIYSLTEDGWKMITQTGVLNYPMNSEKV